MKKKLAAILMSAVCGAAVAVSVSAPCSAAAKAAPAVRLMGDLDGDLSVSVEDAQMALQLYTDSLAEKASANADLENGVADIDMDGKIDAGDAQNILSYYCRTLSGQQPLWAEYREVSYIDGNDHYNQDKYIWDEEAGEMVENPNYEYKDTVFGKTGMYLEVGCAQGAPGETVEVPVYVAGAPLMAGFQFYLNQSGDALLTAIRSDLEEMFPNSDFIYNTDPEVGALVWCAARGDNMSVEDGTVIGTFSYRIPENAESGAHYPLVIDKVNTMFVTNGEELGGNIFGESHRAAYQYTLLDGVIVVK
ncbi:MAG: hypothetical protein IJ060_00595 [Oscillospiraceae bacterium]|nr:hypothetical protein [Oscillospiraceae bacterium]